MAQGGTKGDLGRMKGSPPASSITTSRALQWLLALYLLSAVAVGLQRTLISTENNFLIFRAAFDHLIAGQDLYAAYPAVHADYFKYSPTFALLFAPFALLPLVPGYVLWALVCAGAVFAGVARLLPPRQAAIALAVCWLAVVGDMQRAQSNALCAGLMLLGWAAFERERQWPAAASIIAGAFVKIFPAAALAGAVFHRRKFRFALIVLAVIVIGVALPLVAVSWDSLAAQYHSWHAIETRDAAPLARYGTGGADLYAGLMGQFRVWFGVQWPFWPTQLAGLALLLAPLFRGPASWTARFRTQFIASILVFCVLFNHQAESPSYSIAMIGVAVWFAVSERAWWRTALMAACLIIVNLASTDLLPRALYQAYYVKYLLKTVPLIPLWMVMQAELCGWIGNAGDSEGAEPDQRDLAAPQMLA
jgi:hypothetical protein